MVVITLIVLITLPISRNKMHKVDYFSYYMGYNFAKTLTSELMNTDGVFETTEVEVPAECLYEELYEQTGICVTRDTSTVDIVSDEEAAAMGIVGYDSSYALVHAVIADAICKNLGSRLSNMYDYETIAKLIYDDPVKTHNGYSGVFNPEKAAKTPVKTKTPFNTYFYDVYVDSHGYVDGSGFYFAANKAETPGMKLARTTSDMLFFCSRVDEVPSTSNFNLCEYIRDNFNIHSSACSVSIPAVKTKATSGDFRGLTPHITLSNGLKIYIGTEYEEISDLNDSISEDDRSGFILYIDVNGKSGKTKLYEDVFPYYLLRSGKIVPAYNPALVSGANNKDHMSINVLYDDYSNDKREVKFLLKDANFRRASCATGYVTSSKYCGDKVKYDKCNSIESDCRFMIKQPIKIF